MFRLSVVFCALAAIVAAQCPLSSGFNTNNGLAGYAFDVTNNTAQLARITAMSINADAGLRTVTVHTVTAGTTCVGVQTTPAAWTLYATYPNLNCAGLDLPTPLPGPISIDVPAGASLGIAVFSGAMNYTTGTAANVGNPIASDGNLSIDEGYGVSANFAGANAGRIPSVEITYFFPPTVIPPEYETNSAGSALTINGALGNACGKAVVNQTIYNCSTVTPATGTLTLSTTNVGQVFDMALSGSPLVPASGGALVLPDGQILNIDLSQPVVFMNNLQPVPFPGGGFPGATSSTITVGYSISTMVDVSVQMVVFTPSAPLGFELSQGSELHVAVSNAVPSIAGPATDSSGLAVDVTAAPTCWAPGGIPFFGVSYTSMFVQSNGRVVFVGTDTDGLPSIAEILTDNPFCGFWTDLNPALGGSITVSNPGAGLVRVDYVNVPYAGEAATANTFGIEFDTTLGTVTFDGLTGIVVNPQTTLGTGDAQCFGITKGNTGATNGGSTLFSMGGSGFAANATDAIYDYYTQVAGGAGRVASLAAGTLSTLVFTPSMTFPTNYDWSGQ